MSPPPAYRGAKNTMSITTPAPRSYSNRALTTGRAIIMDRQAPAPWREVFDGGTPETEYEIFKSLAEVMLRTQESTRQRIGAPHALRTLHAKIVLGVIDARLVIDRDLPDRFNVGHFLAGETLPTTVRFSNASGAPQADCTPDMRGIALRVSTPSGSFHDLLMTSFPVSHARNARQFVEFARIAAGDKAQMRQALVDAFGDDETERMLANVQKAIRPCASLTLERYWSRGSILWGAAGPVRFNLRPWEVKPFDAGESDSSAAGLTKDFVVRLQNADVSYRMALQEFVSEESTPIEDGATEWTEQVSPSVDIGTLIIARRHCGVGAEASSTVDALAFNPWNSPAAFRPLGNLNRARKVVYSASAAGWLPR